MQTSELLQAAPGSTPRQRGIGQARFPHCSSESTKGFSGVGLLQSADQTYCATAYGKDTKEARRVFIKKRQGKCKGA
jgi:hypothetical protein